MISILFPSTLRIEANCSPGIILGDTESDLSSDFGDQHEGPNSHKP